MSRTAVVVLWLLALGPVLSACGGGAVRFQPGPAIESVDDMHDIDEPGEKGFDRFTHHGYNFFNRQIREGRDPVPAAPAEDVNRLGQVPDSSWYANRITGLTPKDVALGPGGDDPGPEAFKPWKVLRFKSGGQNPGLVIEDTRGVRHIVKFDKPHALGVTTESTLTQLQSRSCLARSAHPVHRHQARLVEQPVELV